MENGVTSITLVNSLLLLKHVALKVNLFRLEISYFISGLLLTNGSRKRNYEGLQKSVTLLLISTSAADISLWKMVEIIFEFRYFFFICFSNQDTLCYPKKKYEETNQLNPNSIIFHVLSSEWIRINKLYYKVVFVCETRQTGSIII